MLNLNNEHIHKTNHTQLHNSTFSAFRIDQHLQDPYLWGLLIYMRYHHRNNYETIIICIKIVCWITRYS